MPDIRIEFPLVNSSCTRDVYAVYEYGIWPKSSVLAGTEKRTYRDEFKTLEEAKAAYPTAEYIDGTCYVERSYNWLPDDEGILAEDNHTYEEDY